MNKFVLAVCLVISGTAFADGTCTGTYPSYWQDPAFQNQWKDQEISNTAASQNWTGKVFQLSDGFPQALPDERADQPWRGSRFDPLFDPSTDQATKASLALDYSWAVMKYIQEGNVESGDVESDWTLCNNMVRNWYHMPFQTYDVLSSREFVHGLTREAPVTFSLNTSPSPLNATMWAVGFYNPTAAFTVGAVWQANGIASIPSSNLAFAEGAVVGKLLFNTLSPSELPILENMPAWSANISSPSFCGCYAGDSKCSMKQQSQQCPRFVEKEAVRLLQFDIAVKDSRAKNTEWVFGTFVADGQRKASEAPWDRISPLGLMWGNDTPPNGALARTYPANPRQNGFMEEVIFWDTVDMLNAVGGANLPMRPGHLGCNSRLNGPADNANSSCLSCHATASVADSNFKRPPIIAQFGGSRITHECVLPEPGNPNSGLDASGARGIVRNGVSFSELDRLYFYNTPAVTPFNATAETSNGPVNVLPGEPNYSDGRTSWISLDYSLQLSISILQWMEWKANEGESSPTHDAELPLRGQ